jgi:hypothetical protein
LVRAIANGAVTRKPADECRVDNIGIGRELDGIGCHSPFHNSVFLSFPAVPRRALSAYRHWIKAQPIRCPRRSWKRGGLFAELIALYSYLPQNSDPPF